jgi:signal transduction histidine kinase
MLSRLGVRQRLSLLLMLPLTVAVCTIVPFTVDRVDDARATVVNARLIAEAAQVADIVQQLQSECLVELGYLDAIGVDRVAVLDAQEASDESVTVARSAGGPAAAALGTLSGLATVRQQVLDATITPIVLFDTYQGAIQSLLDTLRLADQPTTTATGLRATLALYALLRADEQARSLGAAMLVAATAPQPGTPLIAGSEVAQQQQIAVFHQLATASQRAAFDAIADGASAQHLNVLAATGAQATPVTVFAAASADLTARQLVEDRILDSSGEVASAEVRTAQVTAAAIGATAAVLLILVVVLSVRVGGSITVRLRRLTRAVDAVADMAGAELIRIFDEDELSGPPRLVAVDMRGEDELAELAAGFNRVQATAVLLLERQMSTRRNVATMFTNIARRTQTLVGRQLSLLDDMERNEADAAVLEKLYRLDHIATRLGRSADSLLVIAGTPEESLLNPTPLVDVIRAGMAEIEGFQAIRLGAVCEAVVAARLAGDLRLLMAELMENAASFSPPGVLVEVTANLGVGSCTISVVDRGIGMPPEKLAEENRRMSELQRLEQAPTRFLGLFVVGRLARRHGLTVSLDPSPGQGISATITLPATLYTTAEHPSTPWSAPSRPASIEARAVPVVPASVLAIADTQQLHLPALVAVPETEFDWFPAGARGRAPIAPQPPVPAARAKVETDAQSRGDLRRRTPGQFVSTFEGTPARTDRSRPRDAAEEASQLDAFARGFVQAGVGGSAQAAAEVRPDAVAPLTRGGLQRRIPGAHLSSSARIGVPTANRPSFGLAAPALARDPDSERANFDDFAAGLSRAAQRAPDQRFSE